MNDAAPPPLPVDNMGNTVPAPLSMSFHEHIASFYEALAEEKMDQLVDALQNLRTCVAQPVHAQLEHEQPQDLLLEVRRTCFFFYGEFNAVTKHIYTRQTSLSSREMKYISSLYRHHIIDTHHHRCYGTASKKQWEKVPSQCSSFQH
jgi:hypothetical protein